MPEVIINPTHPACRGEELPNKSVEQYRLDLQRNGVVKIPGVFALNEMQNLRRAIFETLITTNDQRQYQEGGHIQWRIISGKRWPSIIFWPALINEDLRAIRHASRFIGVIRSFLAGDIRQMNNQVYLRLPGDHDEFNIHQDLMFRREVNNMDLILSSYIQTVVAIDRVDSTNGGVEFFLGSHRAGLLDLVNSDRSNLRSYDAQTRRRLEKHFEPVTFELEPGDMLVWNLLVAHGSRANVSERTRMTYMNGFCDSAASMRWPMFIERGRVVNLNAAMIPLKTT